VQAMNCCCGDSRQGKDGLDFEDEGAQDGVRRNSKKKAEALGVLANEAAIATKENERQNAIEQRDKALTAVAEKEKALKDKDAALTSEKAERAALQKKLDEHEALQLSQQSDAGEIMRHLLQCCSNSDTAEVSYHSVFCVGAAVIGFGDTLPCGLSYQTPFNDQLMKSMYSTEHKRERALLDTLPEDVFLKSGVAAQFHTRFCMEFAGETMADKLAELRRVMQESDVGDIEVVKAAADRVTKLHEFHSKRRAVMKKKFVRLDKDKDGTLSPSEISDAAKEAREDYLCDTAWTEEQQAEMMRQLDFDNDGKVTLDEFCCHYRNFIYDEKDITNSRFFT